MAKRKIKVSGLAVKEGVSRNGIFYGKEELDKFSKTLEGVSIIKDHEAKVDNAIGVVTKTESIDNGVNVTYEGWVKDDDTGIAEKIEDGRVRAVSIGAMCGRLVKESEDSDVLIAKDMTAAELSTVVVPGVPGASISAALKNNRRIVEDLNDFTVTENSQSISYNENSQKTEKEDNKIMEGNNSVPTVSVEDFNKVKEELAQLQQEKLDALKEKYSTLCKELNIAEKQDLTKEMLNFAVETLEDVKMQPVKEAEESEEEEKTEEESVEAEEAAETSDEEESKEEEKTEESTEETSEDEKSEEESEESEDTETEETAPDFKSKRPKVIEALNAEGYKLESADSSGMAFYRD